MTETETGKISKQELLHEEIIEQVITLLIERFGTVKPRQRENILKDLKLSDKKKGQIIKEMDESEAIFRKEIYSQKEHFISELQKIDPNPEARLDFLTKIIKRYEKKEITEKIFSYK